MSLLPWILLASTLLVRWRLARHDRRGFLIDLATVPPWLVFYAEAEAWPLIAIPLLFGALDLKALAHWWR